MFNTISFFSLLSLIGCDNGLYCTEIGCETGITLTFIGPDGEAVANVSGRIATNMMATDGIDFDCASSDGGENYFCNGNSVTFFTEEMDTIYVSADSDPYMISTEIALEWETFTPNGEECPPVCYNAEAEVSMERSIAPD